MWHADLVDGTAVESAIAVVQRFQKLEEQNPSPGVSGQTDLHIHQVPLGLRGRLGGLGQTAIRRSARNQTVISLQKGELQAAAASHGAVQDCGHGAHHALQFHVGTDGQLHQVHAVILHLKS